MKRVIKILTLAVFVIAATTLFAQTPPHPNGGEDPGTGGNTPVGGAAPIDGGISLLIALGAAYGARKVYVLKK